MRPDLRHLFDNISHLVSPELFQIADPSAALDLRYNAAFESEWTRIHTLLSEHNRLSPHSIEVSETIHAIEQAAFKAVYSATNAPDFTEFAPLVSDDFSLFAHAIARDIHDPWLNGLFSSYMKGEFPSGRISCIDVSIPVLLKVGA